MDDVSKPDTMASPEKLKFEPFRINVKNTVKDAPIFDIDNDLEEHKIRSRRISMFKDKLRVNDEVLEKNVAVVAAVATIDDDLGTTRVEVDTYEPKDDDVLEVNAERDSGTEKEVDEANTALEEKTEKDNEAQKPKKHKKHEKHEKRKKRRKEKSDENTHEKRHKKHRHERRSRSKKNSRSPSSSSTGKHRKRSSSGHPESMSSESRGRSRNRTRERSRDRNILRNSRGDEWRYSPSRFDSILRSRSRSPLHLSSNNRVRHDQSSRMESAGTRRLSRSVSPKAKLKRQKSPKRKSIGDKSPGEISPRDKTPGTKSRREKSPRDKPHKSHRTKSRPGKSPRKKSPTQLDSSSRKKSNSDTSQSKTRVHGSFDEPLRRSDDRSVDVELSPPKSPSWTTRKSPSRSDPKSPRQSISPVKSPHVSPRKSPHVSPRKSPHKSPLKSPRNKPEDVPEPASVVLHSVDMDITENDNTDGGTACKGESESSVIVVENQATKEVYEGIADGSSEKKKKKQRVKRVKKTNEEKKKKRKGQARVDVINVDRISDDELEDLLFTKTNKETKFEAVFHDSDLITAKHNIRTAVLDVEPKPTAREETATIKEYPECQDISPVASPDAIVATDTYEPEEPTQTTPPDYVPPLEPPPAPPVIPGFFPTIPFLTTTEETQEETNEDSETLAEMNAAPYSPDERPMCILGSEYDSSPENPSTVHLSDISTKESTVESTVGVITRKEKIEDFLDRMPGSFMQHDASEVVDMDMSSPTNGLDPLSENDDDIIEQLHKEFVRAQSKDVPEDNFENTWVSEVYEPGILSPSQDAGEDPVDFPQMSDEMAGLVGIVGIKHRKRKHKSRKQKNHNPFAKEKKDIEDALNRVHRQARVEDEMKHVLKSYFKHKDITKEEYKMILRKAVPQVANSGRGIDPERIRSLVKKYVAKYKGQRLRNVDTVDYSLTKEAYSPPLSQDFPITFSP